jgi:uncharacterized protein DUF6982
MPDELGRDLSTRFVLAYGRELERSQDRTHVFKVVAHYLDGRLVKGETFDLAPARSTCLIHTLNGQSVTVTLSELKSLFIVRDYAGRPDYKEVMNVNPADPRGRGARWLEMTFLDGEVVIGLSTNFSEELPVFAVVPTDTNSNNTRIIVNRGALKSLRVLRPA